MPVKLRTAKALRLVITETMIDLYARGVEIIEASDDEEWEVEVVSISGENAEPYRGERHGGRRREFCEIDVELQSMLGRRPWQATIFEVGGGDPPPHYQPIDDWEGAQALRRELQRALDARRRGRPAGSKAKRATTRATTDV